MTISRSALCLAVTAAMASSCGGDSGNVPDARRTADAPSTFDATPADATVATITVVVADNGNPLMGATVFADDDSGAQPTATTADDGTAVLPVSSNANVTAVVQLGANAIALTMNGVSPGEVVNFALPDNGGPTISTSVTGVSPDQGPTLTLYSPDQSEGGTQITGDGTTASSVALPAAATTTPVDLIAVNSDGSQYVAATGVTFTDGQQVALPTSWQPTSTVTYRSSSLSSDVVSVRPQVDVLSSGFPTMHLLGLSAAVSDGAGDTSMNIAPVGDSFTYGFQFVDSAGESQAVLHTSDQPQEAITVTNDQLGSWISGQANLGTSEAPLGISWSIEPLSQASPNAPMPDGIIALVSYTTTGGTAVTWISSIDTTIDASSWTLPTLPSSLSALSPTGSSDFGGFPLMVSSSNFAGYDDFRVALFSHLANTFNNDGSWLGDATIAQPFAN